MYIHRYNICLCKLETHTHTHTHTHIYIYIHHKFESCSFYEYHGKTLLTARLFYGGARGVVVIVVGNELGDSSSNPGRD